MQAEAAPHVVKSPMAGVLAGSMAGNEVMQCKSVAPASVAVKRCQ